MKVSVWILYGCMQLIVLIICIYFLLESMLISLRKVGKSVKISTNIGKFILYSITLSQEIRVAEIVILIASIN